MSDLSKVTKEQLAEQLANAEERAEQWRARSEGRDADAQAIDGCVRALDALNTRASRNSNAVNLGYSSGGYYAGPASPVERVLAYLGRRYGIQDTSGERDFLRRELDEARQELARLNERLSMVTQAVRS